MTEQDRAAPRWRVRRSTVEAARARLVALAYSEPPIPAPPEVERVLNWLSDLAEHAR